MDGGCASGDAVDALRSTWTDCRDRCKIACQENGMWSWQPDEPPRDFQDTVGSVSKSSRAGGDLGSSWEDKMDTHAVGRCKLFDTGVASSVFRGIAQDASCDFDDLSSAKSLWDPKDVLKDIEASILPGESFATADKHGGSRLASISRFDKSLSVLNDSDGAHTKFFGTQKKLLRVAFAPPTPQYDMLFLTGGSKAQGQANVVEQFNELLVQLVSSIERARHILERAEVKVRQVNAIQVMKYNRVRTTQQPYVKANYFELVMVLNHPVVVPTNLYRIPRSSRHLVRWGFKCSHGVLSITWPKLLAVSALNTRVALSVLRLTLQRFVAAGRIPGDVDGKNSPLSAAEKKRLMVWLFVLFAVALLCLLTWIYVVCWRSFYFRRFKPQNSQRCSNQTGGNRASSVELVGRDALVKSHEADEQASVFDAEPVVLGAGIGTTVKYDS